MKNIAWIKTASIVGVIGLLAIAPTVIWADGYAPLNLPERGNGPSGVQGESTTSTTPSATPSATSTPEETAAIPSTGTIQRVEDGQLIVTVDGKERAINIPEDAEITRDGQAADLSDLQSGDVASFEKNDVGDLTEVRVASEQSMSFWRGFLPILLVVLVGFYLLSRRAKRTTA